MSFQNPPPGSGDQSGPYGQPGFGQPGHDAAGQPATGPTQGPVQGPANGPMQGPTDGPVAEYLSTGSGAAVPPSRPDGGKKGVRRGVVVGLVVGAFALVGGGVWAWMAFFNQGPQPAEALPADTLAYVSVDLDPSGQQKIEALKALRKFPAFKDNVGLDTDDDVRKRIFEEMQDSGVCTELDYDDDVEPWLGDRAAVAVVDLGNEQPDPVLVVQVDNQDKAEDGLNEIVNCGNDAGGESQDIGGYAFNGDWVVIAETQDIAEQVVDDAKDSSLDDDDTYQKWTDAVGDPGVLNVYASPDAGDALAEFQPLMEELESETGSESDELVTALKDFKGGAGTVRFDDGSLEVEFATGQMNAASSKVISGDRGDDTLATLPDSTAVAFGAGMADGWGDAVLDQLRPIIEQESGMSYDEAIAEFESESGLSVPEDLEAALGESFVVAVDSDFDPDQVADLGPTELPIAFKVKGDPDEVEQVLDKLREKIVADGGPSDLLNSEEHDGYVIVSPNQDYLDKLVDEGGLGDDDTFKSVVPEAGDSSAILYADFDNGDWLIEVLRAAGAPDEVIENAEPLEALGVSSWTDGDEVHALLKLTTE